MTPRTPLTLLLLLGAAKCGAGQNASGTYAGRKAALQQRGITALAAEARSALEDQCSTPANTADTSRCLRQAGDATESNYESYVSATAALLRLQPPETTALEVASARQDVRNFRSAESLWVRYRDAQCDAVQTMQCAPALTRRHLQEIAGLYARLYP